MLIWIRFGRYGFTEAAYNFQNNNFAKGGSGNDRVTASIQDSGGTDNANFATPADGQSGHMNMYLWDYTSVRFLFFSLPIVSHNLGLLAST